MPTVDIQVLVEAARQAWLTGNGNAFAILFNDQGEFIVPGNRWVGHHQIHQAVVDYAAAYDEVDITLHRVIQDGNQIVIEWTWQDREKTTGKYSRAEDAIVVDLDQGRIRRWREYIDVVDSKL
ncbi:hypothetical protein Lepto7375DRAFT_5060 [Leptolyngbya sp. PCC 7375]|nr:hypothetical protein Lepto7375DRAFT_5060 [Leptolyngbya sp. PCC 7375]